MYYSGFQNNAFQRNAFQILIEYVPLPLGLKGAGNYKKHNKSFKHSVKESLEDLLAEPKVVEQVKEIIEPYSNSKQVSLSSIDFKLLSKNVEVAERIINMAMEMQREREDEEAILLLM
jgi:long-subunit acyl-CoA synthetase (AMP-forming)